MEVEVRGVDRFICREGIVEVYVRISKQKQPGHNYIMVTRLDLHGSVEISDLVIVLRKCREYLREHYVTPA